MSRMFIGAVEDEWQLYSDRASDYTLGSIIGFGASSIVYTALYHPPSPGLPTPQPVPCALKVLDLDSLAPRSLSLLQRETTLMSLSKHPNVIRVRGSWIDGHKLYIAMRLMNKGSAADVMRYGWPGGMEEEVVKCILRQALQGLNYLHVNGFIHRDIKAANLLIDDDGTVLLGDLGVAADLTEDTHSTVTGSKHRTPASAAIASRSSLNAHDQPADGKRVVLKDASVPQRPRIGKRKSFVGTPCWMAPELIQGRQYDASADIWSFGITALELTQGRPPRSRESSQKVLISIIQEEPPTLDREGGSFKYSRAFKEIVASCLVKDPSQRPTAAQLLQSPFFKSAKKPSYLVSAILKDLPPLALRQERRPITSALSHRTVESWDFATTIHTPTSSVYRRGRNADDTDFFHRSTSGEDVNAVDGDLHANLPGRRHVKGVSWPDNSPVLEEDMGELPDSPAASSPSDRIFSEDNESPTDASTSPSSVSLLDMKPSKAAKEAVPPPSQSTPIPIPSHSTSLAEPGRHSRANEISTSSQSQIHDSPPLSSSGLWRKLKSATNIRRPSSRGGSDLISDQDREKELCKISNRKSDINRDTTAEMGLSRFARKASAGKHALAEATSRTVQAVGLMKS